MHIFKITFFLMLCVILGQETIVQIPSVNAKIVADSLHLKMKDELNLSLEYSLENFSLNPDQSIYSAINNEKFVDTLLLYGMDDIRISVMDQITNPIRSVPISGGFGRIGEKMVQRYYFLREAPQFQFGLIDDDRLGARLHFSPEFESHFSGLFGMNKQHQNWNLNGEIDLHLENLIQTAGMFDLYWIRTDSLSQIIQIEFMEPHPFGWEVGTQFRYHHEIISGFYTVLETKSMLRLFVPLLHQLNLGYTSGQTYPTEKGQNNGYEKIRFKAFSLSTNADSRNHRFVPNKGTKFSAALDAGLQEETGFMKGEFDLHHYIPLTQNIHSMARWTAKGIYGFKTEIPKSRYMIYGGANTLRGFKEQQFSAPQFQVMTWEATFQPISSFQTTLFMDAGTDRLNLFEHNDVGYGIGFTQLAERTLIKVQYALAKGQGFDEGKIHIKWVSRL